MRLEPGERRLLLGEDIGPSVYEDIIGRYRPQTTRCLQRYNAFAPPIALVPGRTQRAVAPQDSVA